MGRGDLSPPDRTMKDNRGPGVSPYRQLTARCHRSLYCAVFSSTRSYSRSSPRIGSVSDPNATGVSARKRISARTLTKSIRRVEPLRFRQVASPLRIARSLVQQQAHRVLVRREELQQAAPHSTTPPNAPAHPHSGPVRARSRRCRSRDLPLQRQCINSQPSALSIVEEKLKQTLNFPPGNPQC